MVLLQDGQRAAQALVLMLFKSHELSSQAHCLTLSFDSFSKDGCNESAPFGVDNTPRTFRPSIMVGLFSKSPTVPATQASEDITCAISDTEEGLVYDMCDSNS